MASFGDISPRMTRKISPTTTRKIELVSFKKVKKHVVKQYNSKRPL
jgi:hypothetical protein